MKKPAKFPPLILTNKTLAMKGKKAAQSTRLSTIACLLLASSSVFAGVQTQENTRWIGVAPSSIDQIEIDKQTDGITRYYVDGFGNFTFAVEDQSVWGPSGPSTYEANLSLTPSQWDSVFGRAPRARVGVGAIAELCVPLLGCAKAGAAAGIELEAYILPYVELEFNPGNFDAVVNYKPTVKYQSTGLGLDFSQLETSSGEYGGKLTLEEPSIYLQTGLTIDTSINLFAEACLGGCFLDESFKIVDFDAFNVPLVTLDTRAGSPAVIDNDGPIFEIFYPDLSKLDGTTIAVEDLLFDPVNAIAGAGREVLYLDAGGLLADAAGGAVDAAGQAVRNELSEDGKKAFDKLANGLSPISVELSLPWASSEAQSNGLSGQFGGELLAVSLDIDKVIGYAFGLKDGLEFDLSNYGVPDVIDAKVVLGDAKAGPVIELQTEVSLNPELMVNLQFDSEVYIAGKIGKQTSYQGSWENLPAIGLTSDAYILRTNEAGETESPDDKTVTATTDFNIQATLTNRTYLDLKAKAKLELLSASIDIKGDGLPGLSIGPVLKYEVTSESLGQLDIFNDSFAVKEWNKSVSNNTDPDRATDKLEFNAFGEILFQARGKGDFDDFYENDARINVSLSTSSVIDAQEARAKAAAPDEGIYGYTQTQTSEFYQSIKNELKIDNRTAAHVMVDGLFTNNSGKTLTIEQGGNLELGKSNPFEKRSLANERLAAPPSQPSGLANEGVMQVFGEVFSNSVIDNPNYVFKNASKKIGFSTPVLEVGASGRVKFDGTFINDGYVQNYGSIELTGESNRSSNWWDNKHGSSMDLYGKLDVSRPDFYALTNSGSIRLHEGAELEITRDQVRSATEPATSLEGHPSYADVHNYGHLNIELGAELRLSGAGGAELLNLGTVSNSGFTLNNTGQLISNGTSALAFDTLVGSDDLWENGQANMARNSSLTAINDEYANFVDKNAAMQVAVTDYRNARVEWLGTNNESEQERFEKTFTLLMRTFGSGEPNSLSFVGEPGLNIYRNKDGIIDEAYGKVSALIDTMKASGFAVWENVSGGLLVNEGTFDNNAVMVNNVGASVFNSGGLNNQGYLKNAGLLVNNQPDGSVQNTGRIDNGSPSLGLVGMSEVVNLGNLENRGELVNHDTLVNYGKLENRDDGTGRTQTTKVQNNGSLSNLGTLENQAAFANARGAETNNYGVINNDGVMDNHGFINNGVQGTSLAQTDVANTAMEAGNFYAAIQQLSNNKQDLENLNQQYENESARLRRIGFMGMLNEGEAGENTEAWATFLYEKYLVSNLADQTENAQFFGPNQGSLEADRKSIRDEVLQKGTSAAKVSCKTSQLECYKAYFGGRNNSLGGSTAAINYDFSFASGQNTGIQALSQYALSNGFSNANQGDDENRFLWTLLMMLEAEGVSSAALNCVRNESCRNNGPSGNNGFDENDVINFLAGYGGDNSDDVKISGIDGYYASWIDKVAFDGTKTYESNGYDLSLSDVNSFGNPVATLAGLYKERQAAVGSINDTINTNSLAALGFDTGSIPNLSDLKNVDFQALVSVLNSALRTASFDLASVTSMDADLNNTGTINNRGVINNRATINNEENGTINNSGALVIGATATLNNDGDVILNDFELPNGEVQSGLLMSHGTIDNNQTGLIEIVSGTLINGRTRQQITDSDGKFVSFGDITSDGVINNRGEIKLSALAQFVFEDVLNADGTTVTDPSTGAALQEANFMFPTASLINEGTLNNFAGALLQIGQDDPFMLDNRLFSLNVLTNSGEIYNDGSLENYGTLNNSGLVENRAGSTFISKGLINNKGDITFTDSTTLGGEIINNGLIDMSDGQLLTLTGRISGNGTFVGNTLIQGSVDAQGKYTATVSPGNSPGLLTFDGNVEANNVNWVMEIWGTERGVSYDAVDILGDFTLGGGMSITLLALLDFDTLTSQDFNFLSITGNLFNAAGGMIANTFAFVDFSASMADSWAGEWIKNISGGWDLNFSFIADNADLYSDLRSFANIQAKSVDVPEPGTLSIFLLGLLALGWRVNVRTKNSADS